MNHINELMQKLCDPGDSRKWMRTTFQAAGYVAATNGHMLIAIQAPNGTDANSERVPSNVKELIAKAEQAAKSNGPWIRIDSIQLPEPERCEACRGRGFFFEDECTECEDGEFDHGSHTYECKNCDGCGVLRRHTASSLTSQKAHCWTCNGTGEATRGVAAVGTHFAANYIRLLASLPNSEIAPPEKPMASTFIRFDGGIAIVMPRRED